MLIQNWPFCLPLQLSVPSMQGEAHLLHLVLATVLLSQKEHSARKAISCKNSGQRRNNKTTACAQSYSPGPTASFQTLAHQVEEIGDNAEKSSFPQGESTEPIPECANPNAPVIPHLPTVRGCTAPPVCSCKGKKTAQGEVFCIALNNEDQVVSGITKVMVSSQIIRTINWNEYPSAASGWTITDGTELSLPAAEHSTC